MEEIQTGNFGRERRLSGKTLKFVGLALGFVVVGVGTYLAVYASQSHKYQPPPLSYYVPANLTPGEQANYLANHNHYQAAVQVWQQQLAHTTNITSKINIYFMLSSLALKFKKYTDAILYANEAKILDTSSPAPYVALAQVAEAESKFSLAKQYLQQAISHLNPNQPGYNLIKADYQSEITSLK